MIRADLGLVPTCLRVSVAWLVPAKVGLPLGWCAAEGFLALLPQHSQLGWACRQLAAAAVDGL